MVGEISSSGLNPEQLQRQQDALRAIQLISRAAGREVAVISGAETISPAPGVYILDPVMSESGRISDANFQLEERMLSGAANSAHAVLAGELEVTYGRGQSATTEVAAKCYRKRSADERYERVKREVEVTRDMAARGELALEPIAVAIAPPDIAEGSTVLLTRLEADLFTLDNHAWGRGLTATNVAMAAMAANTLGRFNTFGYRHGDGKIKNVAGKPGQLGMIDFETTEPIDTSDPMQVAEAIHKDMGMLLDSLSDKGFFEAAAQGTSYEKARAVADAVRDISDAYLANWETATDDIQMAALEAMGEVAQDIVGRHSLIPISV